MIYGDLQFVDIIIFAGISIFLILRLRNVLGKRTGFQKQTIQKKNNETTPDRKLTPKKDIPDLDENFVQLKKAYEALEDFDHKNFIEGAKAAFETIINSFNQGDKKTLKRLLTKDVFEAFEKEIDKKNTDLESQFFSLNVEKIESVVVENNIIKISVKFISEQFKNNDENTITKKEDSWIFEKPTNSTEPNWLLSST